MPKPARSDGEGGGKPSGAVRAARDYLKSMLRMLLAFFINQQELFMIKAYDCQMGFCTRVTRDGVCALPLVPHAVDCASQTYCVEHCTCYAEAAREYAEANVKGKQSSSSGLRGAPVQVGSGSSALQGGSSASAASRGEVAAHPDAASSQHHQDMSYDDDYCAGGGGGDGGMGGDSDVSDALDSFAPAPGKESALNSYYNQLTSLVDGITAEGQPVRVLRGARPVGPNIVAVNDFVLVDLSGSPVSSVVDATAVYLLNAAVSHVRVLPVRLASSHTEFVLLCDCCEVHSNFIADLLEKQSHLPLPYSSLEELLSYLRRYDGDTLGDGSFGQLMVEECLHTAAVRQLLTDTRFSVASDMGTPQLAVHTDVGLSSKGSPAPFAYVSFHPSAVAFSVLELERDLFPAWVRVHRGALRCSEQRRACRTLNCSHVTAVLAVARGYPESLEATGARVPERGSLPEGIHDKLQVNCISFRPLPFDCSDLLRETFARHPRHSTSLVPDGGCICCAAGDPNTAAAGDAAASDVGGVEAGGVSTARSVPMAAAAAAAGTVADATVVNCVSCRTHCDAGHVWGELVQVTSSAKIVTLDQGVITDVVMFERKCSVADCAYALPYDGQQDGYLVVSKSWVWDLRLLYMHGTTLAVSGATFHELAEQITNLAQQLPNQRHVIGRDVVSQAFWAFLSLLKPPPLEYLQCAICGPPGDVPCWVVDGTHIGTLTENYNLEYDVREEVVVKTTVLPRDLYLFRNRTLLSMLSSWLSTDGLDVKQWPALVAAAKTTTFVAQLLPSKHQRHCPPHMRKFFEALASESISYALLCDPLVTSQFLGKLETGDVFTQEHRQQLLFSMPELDSLLTGGDDPLAREGYPVHDSARPLLAALASSVACIVDRAKEQTDLDALCKRGSVTREEDLMNGHCFHPEMRQRFSLLPLFLRDMKKRGKSASTDDDDDDDVPSSCRHAMNKGSRWASVLIDYVCPHGISYGSSMVPQRESLKAIHVTLRERLGPSARFLLIYDYGCAFSRYVYFRDPAFALRQVVKVDRFHAPGHNNCSPACSFKYNKSPSIANINTAAAEQRNAQTARAARQVHFMTGLHARQYLEYVSVQQNAAKNSAIGKPARARPPLLKALPPL